jgi:hypothetical protein
MSVTFSKPTDNEPVSLDLLSPELAELESQLGIRLSLEPLGRLKAVADATTKALIRSRAGRPVAVILCSRPIAPNLVARGAEMAEAIRAVIGEELGRAIIEPLKSGRVNGCSYVVLPYCHEFSKWKPLRVAQRLRLKYPLFKWLRQANTAAASRQCPSEEVNESFTDVLERLERQKLFGSAVQSAICHALRRMDAGRWQPRHTLDHNDLYLNNIMLPASGVLELSGPSRYPFVLIDWVGANPKGFGLYDLIRVSRAFKLTDAALHRELVGHAAALQCNLEDTRGHLLASLGRLHHHLEHFPEARFAQTFMACWNTLNQALALTAAK